MVWESKMNQKICLILILIILTANLSGCVNKEKSTKDLAGIISRELNPIDFETVDSYAKFKDMADNINNLITLLNEEADYEIQGFDGTAENYQKISRVLTEYSPLINNYNEVVHNATQYYTYGTPENEKYFYIAVGKFGLEMTLITTLAFGSVTYEGVGILYRVSGLNRIAFSCPTCVKIILSDVHWSARTYMVEESSETADKLLNLIGEAEIEVAKQKSQDFVNDATDELNNLRNSLQ